MSEAIKITSDVIGKNADASQEINVYELFQGKVLQNQQNIALFCIKGKNHFFNIEVSKRKCSKENIFNKNLQSFSLVINQ